jgi:hypothetical protein
LQHFGKFSAQPSRASAGAQNLREKYYLASNQDFTVRRKSELGVIPTVVPRFFFPAAVWRARDGETDLLFAETG